MKYTEEKLEELYTVQRGLIEALFKDIPNLQRFETENRWQSYLSIESVNGLDCVKDWAPWITPTDEVKAWLLEVGITFSELTLLHDTARLVYRCPKITQAGEHKREDYVTT